MNDTQMPDLPEGWVQTEHEEIKTHGIGEGFVLFAEVGQSIRGFCRTFFRTKHGVAVAIELTQPPTASVYVTSDDGSRSMVHAAGGTLVNLSLSSVDLERKISDTLIDLEVGVQYADTVPTKSGAMKIYRVLVFRHELPR